MGMPVRSQPATNHPVTSQPTRRLSINKTNEHAPSEGFEMKSIKNSHDGPETNEQSMYELSPDMKKKEEDQEKIEIFEAKVLGVRDAIEHDQQHRPQTCSEKCCYFLTGPTGMGANFSAQEMHFSPLGITATSPNYQRTQAALAGCIAGAVVGLSCFIPKMVTGSMGMAVGLTGTAATMCGCAACCCVASKCLTKRTLLAVNAMQVAESGFSNKTTGFMAGMRGEKLDMGHEESPEKHSFGEMRNTASESTYHRGERVQTTQPSGTSKIKFQTEESTSCCRNPFKKSHENKKGTGINFQMTPLELIQELENEDKDN